LRETLCRNSGILDFLHFRVRDAHRTGDTAELNRIYGFAKWCLEQRSGELSNAAAVAFYEHLVDDEVTLRSINSWITPEMFDILHPLFEPRMPQDKYHQLLAHYRFQKRARKRHGS